MNNMTDIIEQYIKKLFQDSKQDFITIKRSNVAEKFDCVPSQLNYVIKTRFTPEQGFLIESKRGGGGFVRITKITLNNNVDYIDYLINNIKNEDAAKLDYARILKILKEDNYINYFDYITMITSLEYITETSLDVISIINKNLLDIEDINSIINQNKKNMMIKFLTNIKYNKENV